MAAMHVHFVAVSGTGMGALAGLFQSMGHRVSGSDTAFYPPMGPALRRWGITLREGFSAENLDPRPDLVVIGNVCRPQNPEARAAIDGGIPYASMAHALAELVLARTSPLVVGGTHGKTTTSTLAAYLLDATGRAPGFLVGGLPKNFEESYRAPTDGAQKRLPLASQGGRKTPFVVEGDEYDTAFFEKTPKFWHYRPEVAIITSIEHDHIDIYPSESAYLEAFQGFVERVPETGLVVANAADPRVVEVVSRSAKAEIAWYALEGQDTHGRPPHWLAAPVRADESGQSFDLYVGGVYAGRPALRMPGTYNVANATAALAAICQGYGVPVDAAMGALPGFLGVRRRQDLLFEASGVRVYDDFAHHPTAVDETLRGLRARHPGGALWAVFEPRSATACRALHQEAYGRAFGAATRVILAPLGRPDIAADERLDRDRIVADLATQGVRGEAAPSVPAIVERIVREAEPGDTVALLSNGAFGGIYETLKQALTDRPAR